MIENNNIVSASYMVANYKWPWLQEQVAKLNRRAVKLCAVPIKIWLTGETKRVEIKSDITGLVERVKEYVGVQVEGAAPKFNGWTLAACVEHTAEGNLLRKTPDCKIELTQFRTGAQHCDHCQTERNRRETFIVLHEDGSMKMIGRNCIRDFLGHSDPHALAHLAELYYSLHELGEAAEDWDMDEFGYRARPVLSVPGFLAYAATAIRRLGFISRKTSEERNCDSTAALANAWMNPFRGAKLGKDYFVPEDADKAFAEAARENVLNTLGQKDPIALSDFEHSLLTACKCETVEPRNSGILAFVPEYYSRTLEQAKQAALETYFGEVGKRIKGVVLTYIKSTSWDSQFGTTFLHSFVTQDGARVLWKTGNELGLTPSAQVKATFTVKAHEEFKGHKQTKVSRMVWEVAA
jgi:hypothetical protein